MQDLGITMCKMKYVKCAALLMMIMAVLDITLTLAHFRFIDGASEANPFMKWIFESYGVTCFTIQRMATAGLSIVCLIICYEKYKVARIGFWFTFVVHILIAIYHCYGITLWHKI